MWKVPPTTAKFQGYADALTIFSIISDKANKSTSLTQKI